MYIKNFESAKETKYTTSHCINTKDNLKTDDYLESGDVGDAFKSDEVGKTLESNEQIKDGSLKIILEPRQDCYLAGDVICGYVEIHFKDDASVKELSLKCSGKTTLRSALSNRSYGITFHSIKLLSLRQKTAIKQGKSGKNRYPFEFQLPETLPSTWISFEGSFDIQYWLSAKITETFSSSSSREYVYMTKTNFIVSEIPAVDKIFQGVTTITHNDSSRKVLSCFPVRFNKTLLVRAKILEFMVKAGKHIIVEFAIENHHDRNYWLLFGFSREISLNEGSTNSPRLIVPQKVCVNIPKKSSFSSSYSIDTTDIANFTLQPSVTKSQSVTVKDSIFIGIAKAGHTKILKEAYLPIYIYSDGIKDI